MLLVSELEHTLSGTWSPVKATPELAELTHISSETLRMHGTDLAALYNDRSFIFDGDQPEYFEDTKSDAYLDFQDAVQHFFSSNFFQSMSFDNQVIAARASTTPEIMWLADYKDMGDGLWPAETPLLKVPAGRLSRFVLNGALGAELQQENKKLEKFATQLEGDRLKRAILVGAASLAASFDDTESYYETPVQGGVAITTMGADMHGDFYSRRQTRLQGLVRDSATGFSHQFAPIIDDRFIRSYHSQEPYITQALLAYLVEYKGEDPAALRAQLLARIEQKEEHIKERWGAFGDFDTQDGALSARAIQGMVKGESGRDTQQPVLDSIIVTPQHEARLKIEANTGGVSFRLTGYDESRTGYFIKDDEMVEYIATLVCSTGGRVTPRAHIPMIKALVDHNR